MVSKKTQSTEQPLYRVEDWRTEESVGYLISQVRARLIAAIDGELSGLGITWAQWVTLLSIATGKARTAAELCRGISGDTGSMTRMLDRLEEKGLIRRTRSHEDRRIVLLELTETGRALYPKLPPIAVKVLNYHLQGFSREELERLKSLLRRMLANADG